MNYCWFKTTIIRYPELEKSRNDVCAVTCSIKWMRCLQFSSFLVDLTYSRYSFQHSDRLSDSANRRYGSNIVFRLNCNNTENNVYCVLVIVLLFSIIKKGGRSF